MAIQVFIEGNFLIGQDPIARQIFFKIKTATVYHLRDPNDNFAFFSEGTLPKDPNTPNILQLGVQNAWSWDTQDLVQATQTNFAFDEILDANLLPYASADILDAYLNENLGSCSTATVIVNGKHSELDLDDGTNPHGTTQADVGLANVDNTSDLAKPISTATQTALDDKLETVATDGTISGDGTAGSPLSVAHPPQTGVESVTGDGVDNTDPVNPVLTFPTPLEIGLGNVDNTSDLAKPISTATQTALDGKVESVSGLDIDNTDPLNPIVQISVDGVTITGAGTPASPLVSSGGGGGGWRPNSIPLGSILISGASFFVNTGAGVYLSMAGNADHSFYFNDSLNKAGSIYPGSDLILRAHCRLSSDGGLGDNVKLTLSDAIVKPGDNSETTVTVHPEQIIDVSTELQNIQFNIDLDTIIGVPNGETIMITVERNSAGAGQDTYPGALEIIGLEWIEL